MSPSFHERLWDLQQRKAGAERLKITLEMARIWEKIALNSAYGKFGTVWGYGNAQSHAALIYEHRRSRLRELETLSREFRPF